MLLAQGPVNNNKIIGYGIGQYDNRTCSISGDPTANINLRCDNQFLPLAETAIAVDPTNPNHLLVGANDFIAGSSLIGFFVSFDGGATWTSGHIPATAGGAADPGPAFNAKFGTAHMAHIGLDCSGIVFCSFSAEVSTSHDGGLSWGSPVRVASGMGRPFFSETAVVNDKPWIVADNNPSSRYYGRLYLTWSRFLVPASGHFESPIYFSYSDDGGRRWSPGVEISGSSSVYCNSTEPALGHRCADDQFSTPVVLPNGTVVVHFLNGDHAAAWEGPNDFDSQTMVVRSTDGGTTWDGPIHIADLEDSTAVPPGYPLPHIGDYPINSFGETTLTGHQFKIWSVQEMIADPVNGNLYAFVTDNRDGIHDSFSPVTESNVFMTKSTDGGITWQGPIRVTSGPGDRWMASGSVYNDQVRVMFLDGQYDFPNRTLYGVTLGSSSDGGSTWSFERVDTAPSNPNNARWFASGASACPNCTSFIGDYQGIAMDALGRAHIVWTDMRRDIGSPPRKAHDIEYARR
jgi:hypothetical protein